MAAKLRNAAIVESERFVEYDEMGGIKGAPKASAKSKYLEDVLNNNHTSVWGSWWSNFKWGYSCCHSMVKNSYCVGETGKRALEDAERARTGDILIDGGTEQPEIEEAVEKPTVTAVDQPKHQTKKRTAEEMHSGVSEEDMDAWKKKRVAADDPMNAFLGKDELV
jgi:pre-mRNA-processing factor SLU7